MVKKFFFVFSFVLYFPFSFLVSQGLLLNKVYRAVGDINQICDTCEKQAKVLGRNDVVKRCNGFRTEILTMFNSLHVSDADLYFPNDFNVKATNEVLKGFVRFWKKIHCYLRYNLNRLLPHFDESEQSSFESFFEHLKDCLVCLECSLKKARKSRHSIVGQLLIELSYLV